MSKAICIERVILLCSEKKGPDNLEKNRLYCDRFFFLRARDRELLKSLPVDRLDQ